MTAVAANPKQKPSVSDHEIRISNIESDIGRHEAFIIGNGSIGAKAEIVLLKETVKEIKDSIKDIKDSMKGVTKAAYTLAASIIGALVIWFLTVYIPSHM